MRESKYADLLVHRSTFNDEFTVREGCVPTGMQFLNGVGIFNGGYIACSKPFKGVYSVRIKFKDITPAGVQYLIDCRAGGTGYIRFDSATAVSASSGTMYVDGVAGSTISASTKEITVTGITLDTFLTYYGTIYTLGGNYLAGGMELLEVYKGTLTAAQVSLIYTNSDRLPDDQRHIKRVLNDGGSVRTISNVTSFERMCKRNGIWNNIKFAWTGETGGKTIVNGIYQNFSNVYSVKGATDATQTTSANRPYLTGNIAPNERYGMLNPNSSQRFVTHPNVSYLATDPWSLTVALNPNGILTNGYFYSSTANTLFGFNSLGQLRFRNESNTLVTGTVQKLNKYIGKTLLITLVADGGGTLKGYANGVLFDTITNPTNVTLNALFNQSSTSMYGRVFASIIRSGALTQSQVTAEYNFFRSIYPEIPTVLIGSQEWATSNLDVVCTPMGNVINEITDNANVEKIVNGGFEAYSGVTPDNWVKGSSIASLTKITSGAPEGSNAVEFAGVGSFGATANNAFRQTGAFTNANRWYKISVWAKLVSGSGNAQYGLQTSLLSIVGTGSWAQYSKFVYASSVEPVGLSCDVGSVYQFDNVSVQLVGWSGLTEVYDAIYAATAGTAAVKDQAGCLAAAAWCHYSNDPANGAIYGKLYNWYAARTLQYDIDAYNAANPTTPWGYRVPTQTDFTTLQTTLGGAAVAGGKMKKEGLSYWTTPNTGADNTSGFSALPGGRRFSSSGEFGLINTYVLFWSITLTGTNAYVYYMTNSDTQLIEDIQERRFGNPIRLIKT